MSKQKLVISLVILVSAATASQFPMRTPSHSSEELSSTRHFEIPTPAVKPAPKELPDTRLESHQNLNSRVEPIQPALGSEIQPDHV